MYKLEILGGPPAMQAIGALTLTDPPMLPATTTTTTTSAAGSLYLIRTANPHTIPPMYFTTTAPRLFINPQTEDSRKYVNGLINQLKSQAVLAKLDIPDATERFNPFMKDYQPQVSKAQKLLMKRPFCVLYIRDDQLVLHLLQSPPPSKQQRVTKGGLDLDLDLDLEMERRFIGLLDRQRQEQMAIQRQLSASISKKTSTPQKPKTKSLSSTDLQQLQLASPATSSDIEETNKRAAKQLIISALKQRGINRSNKEFAALWSQIYRSLKFTLRGKINRHSYTVTEMQREVQKQVDFYC